MSVVARVKFWLKSWFSRYKTASCVCSCESTVVATKLPPVFVAARVKLSQQTCQTFFSFCQSSFGGEISPLIHFCCWRPGDFAWAVSWLKKIQFRFQFFVLCGIILSSGLSPWRLCLFGFVLSVILCFKAKWIKFHCCHRLLGYYYLCFVVSERCFC